MKRVAAVYDVHGNLTALDAVLAAIDREDVDLIVIGGDVVPGPLPRETLARLGRVDRPIRFIRGNGDREVVAAAAGRETATLPEPVRAILRWTAAQYGPEDLAVLAEWPATTRIEIDGLGDVLFCHATPASDTDIFTRLTPEAALRPLFDPANAAVVVCGHTHMQFDRVVGATRVVNAGSVGMPFGDPVACWLMLGPDVRLQRTTYDLEAAARLVRASGYPDAGTFASRNILRPPSEEEMLRAFTR